MRDLFRAKRFAYKLVSKGFYIVFFIFGFICGLALNKVNAIEYIKNLLSEVF